MKEEKGLYLALFSIHGLLRGEKMELGRDPDTGGQITYVVELAKELSNHPDVGRVELFTRQIWDRTVDESYSKPEEQIAERSFIIRVPCGPRRYLHKETLWPYLPNYVDNVMHHFRELGRVPDIVHGHYADAGYVGAQVARLLGAPFIFTGHSLGRVKRERLKANGVPDEKIEKTYNMTLRIEGEEFALDTASLVVASTRQEVAEQYEVYDNYQPKRMKVIAPGVDLKRFSPPKKGFDCRMRNQINRFLADPTKPMVVAMARPDERKNFETLLKAYGENQALREKANLVLVMGNRDDFQEMAAGSRRVLSDVLYLIDRYDLYGSVAYPKKHESTDVPDIYRLATASHGVFVNPALTEPFGLTLLEAAASGVPIVATNDGGPRDIIGACQNGRLIDPLKAEELGNTILEALSDPEQWKTWSKNGVELAAEHFAWSSHVRQYIEQVRRVLAASSKDESMPHFDRSRLPTVNRILMTDVDNTLTGDDEGTAELLRQLKAHGDFTGFGIATGRSKKMALELLDEIGAPMPDIMIASSGANIFYGRQLEPDFSWHKHINHRWYPAAIRRVIEEIPGLYLQPEEQQKKFKISYTLDAEVAPTMNRLRALLRERGLQVKIILSHNMYLDLLPIRASTGLAIRFLAFKWGLPMERLLVAGDSGNDEEMLRGQTLGVVVGNYSSELEKLRGQPRIYFANASYAWGILEGVEHYNFFGEIRLPEQKELDEPNA